MRYWLIVSVAKLWLRGDKTKDSWDSIALCSEITAVEHGEFGGAYRTAMWQTDSHGILSMAEEGN